MNKPINPKRYSVVIIFLAAILCVSSISVGQVESTEKDYQALLPWIESDTCMVARLGVNQIELKAIYEKFSQYITLFPDRPGETNAMPDEMGGPWLAFQGYLDLFRSVGARDIYVIMSGIDLPQMYVVIIIEPGKNGSALFPLLNMIKIDKREAKMFVNFETVRQVGDVIYAGRNDILQRLTSPDKGAPSGFKEAWGAADGSGISAMAFISENMKRTLRESIATEKLGDHYVNGNELADMVNWATMKISFPPKFELTYLVQSADSASARKALELLTEAEKELLTREKQIQEIPDIEKLFELINPRVDGSRLSRQLTGEDIDNIVMPMILAATGEAREQALMTVSMSQIKQLMLGYVMYMDDNHGKTPPDLPAIADKGYLDKKMLTSPLVAMGKSGGYQYRGSDLTKECKSQPMIVVWEKIDDGKMPYLAGFLDGHVERMTADSFREAIERDNAERRKLQLAEKPIE